MLAPAADERPAAPPPPRVAVPPPRAARWLRRVLLPAAVACALADAGAVLAGDAVASARDLPWSIGAALLALALLLAAAPRAPWRFAALDLGAVALLLAAVAAGFADADLLRVGALVAALAWLLVGDFAAAPAPRAWRAVGAMLAAGAVAFAAAAAWPFAREVLGRVGVASATVALALATVWLPRAMAPARPPLRPAALAAVLACLPLAWWVARTWPAVDVGFAGAATAAVGGAVAAAVALRAVWFALALLLGAALFGAVRGPSTDAAAHTVVATHGVDAVVYERATQTLELRVAGEVVARGGPDHAGAELAATAAHLFARPGDRALVLGAGTGRLPAALLACGWHEVEVLDGRGVPDALLRALRADGPVPVAADAAAPDPRVRRAVRPWSSALAAVPDGARQAVFVAESPHARAPRQATVEFQRELRRVAGDGLVVQVFAFDLVDAGALRALLGAAAVAHAWNAVLAVGDDAVLLGAAAPLRWPAADPLADAVEGARWTAHRAHLGGTADLRRAVLGTVVADAARFARSELEAPPGDGQRGRRAALAVLHELLLPDPAVVVADPASVLLRWMGRRADERLAATELAGLGDSDEAAHRASAIAARFLPFGAPTACLQAALGLPAADGLPLVDPALACRRAHAIDPTFFARRPPVLQAMRRPYAERGALEDLALLPAPERLAELCAGDTPFAVALRARFPSACARALVTRLADGPLPPAGTEALRELADPFVLDEALGALRRRDGTAELLSLWRRDLPLPPGLDELLQNGDTTARVRFADALAGRRDGGSLDALADCLVAPLPEVRRAAARALRATAGEAIGYDPDGAASARNEAADRVRSLHNRAP